MKTLTRIINVLCAVAGAISMILTAVMMCYLIADVVSRVIFTNPLKGTYELMQIAVCLIIFSSFAYVQSKHRHIIVSMAVMHLPCMLHMFIETLTVALSVFITAVMTKAIFAQGIIVKQLNRTTDILHLPLYPVYFVVSVLMGIFALALLLDLAKHIFALFGNDSCKDEIVRTWQT